MFAFSVTSLFHSFQFFRNGVTISWTVHINMQTFLNEMSNETKDGMLVNHLSNVMKISTHQGKVCISIYSSVDLSYNRQSGDTIVPSSLNFSNEEVQSRGGSSLPLQLVEAGDEQVKQDFKVRTMKR